MPYTLDIFDKSAPDKSYFFNNRDELMKHLQDYLIRYEDDAKRLGYKTIWILELQGLINFMWDLFNEPDSNCFHFIHHYDGKEGTLLTKKDDYMIVYQYKQWVEKVEILDANKLKDLLIKMIIDSQNPEIIAGDIPVHYLPLDKLIQKVYEMGEIPGNDFGRTIFKIDLNDNCSIIEREKT